MGQCCRALIFCSAWRLELSPPPSIHSLEKGSKGSSCVTKLHEKSPVHKRLHQVNCKREQIGPSHYISPFSFGLVYPSSGSSMWQDQYGIYDLVKFSVLSLLCLNFSPPSLCLGRAQLSCSTLCSVLKFAVGVGSL